MSAEVRNHKLRVDGSNATFVRSPNVGGSLSPKFLVIHYTASGPDSDIARYFARDDVDVSAHLVIRRDGTIFQCVPFNVIAWHAGRSSWTDRAGRTFNGLNSNAIGIELENWGPLRRSGSSWISWTGVPVDANRVIEARHKFGSPDGGWETFADAQVTAAAEAARAICSAYGIEEIVGHDDISPGRKSDPGPAWNWVSFRAKALGRRDGGDATFAVRSPTGLNVRSGPGANFPLIRPSPIADGTRVLIHEAEGQWRFVSVLDANAQPDFSGWVHGAFLRDA